MARDHGVNANLLFNWRRQMARHGLPVASATPSSLGFARIDMVAAPGVVPGAVAAGMMEIQLAGGARVRVDAQVDERALKRVIWALEAAS